MKKSFFLLAVCVCVMLSSCKQFKSQTFKVGDYKLVTSLSEDGEDTLWTIKDSQYQEVFTIKGGGMPKLYGIVFMNKQQEGYGTYYSLNGKELGQYKVGPFKTVEKGLVYEAESENGKVLYFTDEEEVVDVQEYRVFNSYIGIQQKNKFVVSSLRDTTSWTVPEKDFIWVEQPSSDQGLAKPKIVIQGKKSVTVYTVDGAEEQTFPLAKWNKTIKGIEMVPFGTGKRCELKKL